VGLLHWILRRHRDKKAEQEAIKQAANEMRRAGEEEEHQPSIDAAIYPWEKGGGL
jgi:hypothetical protein